MSDDDKNNGSFNPDRFNDEETARKVYYQYVDQLMDLARGRISSRFASRVDAEDVVQSVFRTFFKHARAGDFTLNDPDDLCKLLVRITVFKTLRQIAFHKQAKRDARHETGSSDVSHEQLLSVMSNGPTPDEAVIFLDQLEHFLDQLSPEEKNICQLRMEGYGNTEISEKLDINDRRIRRVLERLRGLASREDWLE